MKLTEINGAKILHYHMVQVIFGDRQIRNLQGKISMDMVFNLVQTLLEGK